MKISKAAGGMDLNKYRIILSPEQQSILLELPTHLQIIGEAATGKTELLKAVAHIIFKYNSGRSKCLQPNVSSLAEGVNRILYFIIGDKPYLKENVNSYFSLLDKNLQPLEGEKMAFQVQSIAGNSFSDICDVMLKVLKSIVTKKSVFILVDECYHWFGNIEISQYLSSFKGCWIASVLTGQQPTKVLPFSFSFRCMAIRNLRRIYRGTKAITLASSSLSLSSNNGTFYLANKFSYIQSHNDMKIEDIEELTGLCKNENDSLVVIFRGRDGTEKLQDSSVPFSGKTEYKKGQFQEIDLQKEKIDDELVYLLRYTGAEWKSVIIILDLSLKEFQLNNDMIYLLLSLCTSRALCRCLILCQEDIKDNLQKRVYPSRMIQDVRLGKCQSVTDLQDNEIMNEFLSVSGLSPLTAAAGAHNLDFIENFAIKCKKDSLLNKREIVETHLYLTEPLPNQRMVDFTRTILTLSEHLTPNSEKALILNLICFFQFENEWHFKILKLIVDNFKFPTIKRAEFLQNTTAVGHSKCAKYLIKAYPDVIKMQSENDSPILIFAAHQGQSDIVKYLIEANADVSMQAEDGHTALTLAAANGYSDIVKYLIEANADVSMQAEDGHTALTLAAVNGYIDIVKYLTEVNADVNMQINDGRTALILASQNGHNDMVKYLIEANANVNIQGQKGATALIVAAQNGHSDIVKYLIEANANVNMQGEKGATALICAANNGHSGMIKFLIEANADANIQAENCTTALILAALNGYSDIVKYLIEANADVNMQTEEGSTALIFAAQNGHNDVIKYLIEVNADINMQGNDGSTALLLASLNGHSYMVKYLIEANADANIQAENCSTALMMAALNGHSDVVKYLIEANADVNMQAEEGSTALMLATLNGHSDMVKYLIEANANVNMQREDGLTPLLLAAHNGHGDIVTYLMDANAEVNMQTEKGSTALLFAAQKGHSDIVKYLIEANADANIQAEDGNTALILAALNGHGDIVKYLIKANANVNLQGHKGATALMLAAQNGHNDMIKYLIEANANINMQAENSFTALVLAAQNGHSDVVKCLIEASADDNM